jgi:hypothetical protein
MKNPWTINDPASFHPFVRSKQTISSSRPVLPDVWLRAAVKHDTGGEFGRRRGATLIRAMIFTCNNDSRQSQLRVFSIFLSSATGKHSRIAPRDSSL